MKVFDTIADGLRALLIHKGVKRVEFADFEGMRLRALLIHKGVKHNFISEKMIYGLRALLIHKGVKQIKNTISVRIKFESFVNS